MMALRQTAPAVRGRPAVAGPLLQPGAIPRARCDPPPPTATPRQPPPPPGRGRLAHPHTFIQLRAHTVGGRQANGIKRQTESCHIRVSEDTGTLFVTSYSCYDLRKLMPANARQKKRTKPGTPDTPPKPGPDPHECHPLPRSPYPDGSSLPFRPHARPRPPPPGTGGGLIPPGPLGLRSTAGSRGRTGTGSAGGRPGPALPAPTGLPCGRGAARSPCGRPGPDPPRKRPAARGRPPPRW